MLPLSTTAAPQKERGENARLTIFSRFGLLVSSTVLVFWFLRVIQCSPTLAPTFTGVDCFTDTLKSQAELRQVTYIVRERQLRPYGHVARLPAEDPANGFFFVEIRGPGLCREGAHTLHGCVRWGPIWRIRAWRAWRLPGRWPDGGRRSTVVSWTRRRAAPAYVPIPDLT